MSANINLQMNMDQLRILYFLQIQAYNYSNSPLEVREFLTFHLLTTLICCLISSNV